jgi:hypothetical protein
VAAPRVSGPLPPSLSLIAARAPHVSTTPFPNRHRPCPAPVPRLAARNLGPVAPRQAAQVRHRFAACPALAARTFWRPPSPTRALALHLSLPPPSLAVAARHHCSRVDKNHRRNPPPQPCISKCPCSLQPLLTRPDCRAHPPLAPAVVLPACQCATALSRPPALSHGCTPT